MCKCGINKSINNINSPPDKNPKTIIIHPTLLFDCSTWFSAGRIKLKNNQYEKCSVFDYPCYVGGSQKQKIGMALERYSYCAVTASACSSDLVFMIHSCLEHHFGKH